MLVPDLRVIVRLAAVTQPAQYTAMEFSDCNVHGNKSDQLPVAKPFAGAASTAAFVPPVEIHVGQPAVFRCTSRAASGQIAERLWDFDNGVPEVTPEVTHTFDRPGTYRVTLIVWDGQDRGGRAESTVQAVP